MKARRHAGNLSEWVRLGVWGPCVALCIQQTNSQPALSPVVREWRSPWEPVSWWRWQQQHQQSTPRTQQQVVEVGVYGFSDWWSILRTIKNDREILTVCMKTICAHSSFPSTIILTNEAYYTQLSCHNSGIFCGLSNSIAKGYPKLLSLWKW